MSLLPGDRVEYLPRHAEWKRMLDNGIRGPILGKVEFEDVTSKGEEFYWIVWDFNPLLSFPVESNRLLKYHPRGEETSNDYNDDRR